MRWLLLSLSLAILAGCSSGGRKPDFSTVVLTWTPSNEDLEGNPINDLKEYRLTIKSSSGVSDLSLPPTQRSYVLHLARGQSVRARVVGVSESLGESDASNEMYIAR